MVRIALREELFEIQHGLYKYAQTRESGSHLFEFSDREFINAHEGCFFQFIDCSYAVAVTLRVYLGGHPSRHLIPPPIAMRY